MDMVIRGEADAAVEVKLYANVRLNAPDGERLRIVAEVFESQCNPLITRQLYQLL
jgi:hypothetical protein